MTDELQSLLDRIRSEGVERAEAEAARIVAEAQERAAGIRRHRRGRGRRPAPPG